MNWNTFPFSPRRFPIFYGWVIVIAAVFGVLASIPGQTMGVGVFTEALIEALGVSRFHLSLAYMAGTLGSSALLPLAGTLIDRLGTRVMVVFSSLGLGASLLFLSLSASLVGLAGEAASLALALVVVTIAFLLIRFFGQGMLTLVSRVVIGKWFHHRRGLAIAVSGLFVSFGFKGSPLLLNWMVENWGWRSACHGLALAVGVGMAAIGWLLFRDNPEDCGLVMDGRDDPEWRARMERKTAPIAREFTRREAVRTPAFWAVTLAVGIHGLAITAFTFHLGAIGGSIGLTSQEAYAVLLPMAFYSVAANLIGGWLSDRVPIKWLVVAMMVAQALGSVGMMAFNIPFERFLLIAGYGVAGGLYTVLITGAYPRFFGRAHLGAISGLSMSILVILSAVAPAMYWAGQWLLGHMSAVAFASLSMPVAIMVLAIWADNPQRAVAAAPSDGDNADADRDGGPGEDMDGEPCPANP